LKRNCKKNEIHEGRVKNKIGEKCRP